MFFTKFRVLPFQNVNLHNFLCTIMYSNACTCVKYNSIGTVFVTSPELSRDQSEAVAGRQKQQNPTNFVIKY